MRARWWIALAGALVVGHSLMPSGLARAVVHAGFAVAAVVMILVGMRRYGPVPRAPWVSFAAGVALWALGDAMWAVFPHLLQIDPFVSAADVCNLLGYPLFAIGVRYLARARNPERDLTARLDAAVVGAVVLAVLWVLVVGPAFESPEADFLAAAVSAAYPIGDVVLLSYLVYLAGDTRFESPALRLLALGLAAKAAADICYAFRDMAPWIGDEGAALDWLWVSGYLLMGLAALHPTMAQAGERQPRLELTTRLGLGKIVFLGLVLLALPMTALVQWVLGDDPDSVELAAAGVAGVVLVCVRMTTMTRRMIRQADRLATLAGTDPLTGLANLRLFTQEVATRLAEPGDPHVPLLLINLDRFVEIKETLGYQVGDELLRAVGLRLTAAVGADGLVARVGGDAFGVVLFPGRYGTGSTGVDGTTAAPTAAVGGAAAATSDPAGTAGTAGQGVFAGGDLMSGVAALRVELSHPFELSDISVSVDGLVGVAVGPDDGEGPDELLQRADVALSAARSRPDRVARYSGRLPSGGALTPHLMSQLPAALSAGELVLHYQPQVEIATGRVCAAEALLRWQHPVHGLLPPAAFVPAAERTGLIRPLTLYVLDQAVAQAARMAESGRPIAVSVNMSVRDLLDPDFPEDVRATLSRHGVDTSLLELEVTETVAMVDPNRSLQVLRALANLGVVLSVDDYGTGYSSLAYLQRLPVRRLKIDRSFVTGLVCDVASTAIVRSTIELARNLGLSVVAEGVEDDATLLALRDMGCAIVQGFGLGRPVPADRIPDVVEALERRVPRLLAQAVGVPRPVG